MKKGLLLSLFVIVMLSFTACLLPTVTAHAHEYGEWSVTKEASCSIEGERTRSCSCGEVETGRIAKEMHVRGEWVTVTEPTCTEKGEKKVSCTQCGEVIVTADVDILPHDCRPVSTTAPTCTEEGYSSYECADCDFTKTDDVIDSNGHAFVDAVYNGDATGIQNGTATGYCSVCDEVVTGEIKGSAELIRDIFSGKKVSVMGDSISTYINISNGTAADTTNSTIRKNSTYYHNVHNEVLLDNDVGKTWWQRTINHLGADLLVNNSDSGGFILDYKDNGNKPAYLRANQLHDDTGEDAGTTPDMVFLYLGTNDFARYGKNGKDFGSVSEIDFDAIPEKCGDTYKASNVAEAYAILLYKITVEYPDAKIYCLSLIDAIPWHKDGRDQKIDAFNAMIAALAEYYGASFVDIYNGTGINQENIDEYVPIYDGDEDDNMYHPNAAGFALISDVLLDLIIENTENYPTAEDFEALANNQNR